MVEYNIAVQYSTSSHTWGIGPSTVLVTGSIAVVITHLQGAPGSLWGLNLEGLLR